MADEMARADEVENLTPEQVAAGFKAGRMLLVDVREPNETVGRKLSGRCDRAAVVLRSRPQSPTRKASRWCLPAAPAAAR